VNGGPRSNAPGWTSEASAAILSWTGLYYVLFTSPHTACCSSSPHISPGPERVASPTGAATSHCMALRLSAWLEETFESQLLLGNQWLQDTFEKKRSGVKAQLHRQWDVYHDNGSSLDIINYVHSDRNSALLVLKAGDTAPIAAATSNITSTRSRLLHLPTAKSRSSPNSRLTALGTSCRHSPRYRTCPSAPQ